MTKEMRPAVCLMLAVAMMLPCESVAEAPMEGVEAVPILWRTPVCEYRKLGVVVAKLGQRVDESRRDEYMPTVRYKQAFKVLSDEARALGGDAVVFSRNQAVFYTYRGKKTHDPVYIHLRGGAIDLPNDTSNCGLEPVDPGEVSRKARAGKPVDTTSSEVYGD